MPLSPETNERRNAKYNQRCVQVEHASFTPLIFSAYGGCSRETYHFLNTLSEQLSKKRGIPPGVAMNWLRTKICFAQTRALILCIRGSRNPWHKPIFYSTNIILSYYDDT